ncbi:MAG: ABC transporter substrate-binding protein [Rickettsiales bacterium]|nr:ABC transporter substrate-binding protein [Pseudomonadota bacterium]MDA0965933.1 ABC transporter substrate-binding protein [Pseudomonadota bacterium]MDG4542597.1 ABC transporter substrate-binding protein [Rickettsiales bacterium]MDG4545101.1 ABC transporter substrate-binding protein [Rickettsiales bacterium]MDG4547224.1 ABC transporter substrate-binding protein [Rickettsiales bacterium]
MNIFRSRFLITLVITFIANVAYADVEGAQKFVKELGDTTIETAKSTELSVDDKEQKLIELFEKSVDTAWIAKFVMGQYWRDMSEEKQNEYKKLYHKYLLQTYVPEFKTYTDEKLKFLSSEKEYENEYIVKTEIVSANGNAYRVDYKVRKNTDSDYKIFDVVAEGISLITTHRSEFGSIVSRKNVDFLIKKLDQKTGKENSN